MSGTKKPRWPFVTGVAVGAALVYYLDPDKGSNRRQQLGPVTSSLGKAPQTVASAGSKVTGSVLKRTPHAPDNPNPDDRTLADRVESIIFADPETSREHINVNVVNGIVELRGEQSTQSAIDNLVKRVREIPNVKGVHNYLHLPGTPAPNKESAIQAS